MNKKRARGKSHSVRPVRAGSPKWVRLSAEEIGTLVVELYKKGYEPSTIGVLLRDQYGVPLIKQVTGKKLTRVLENTGIKLQVPEDLMNLIRRAVNARRHIGEHPRDSKAKKGLEEIESKIRRLERYYKSTKKLPNNWKYDPEQAKLMVRS
ncbi:30S ribosomal protein S15 [Sulfolobales archaeon HS-7]|nr:30S ribosomal protein S15 [Sulfolobales archaeon HS-7]